MFPAEYYPYEIPNSMISDAWDNTKTYSVGEYCIYNKSLWKCLVQNSGQTPAEGTYWHQTSVGEGLSYRYIGTSVGENDLSLPENYNELLVIAQGGNNNLFYTFTIPREILLDNEYRQFFNGRYYSSNACDNVAILAYKMRVRLGGFYSDGNDITNSSHIFVYAK